MIRNLSSLKDMLWNLHALAFIKKKKKYKEVETHAGFLRNVKMILQI